MDTIRVEGQVREEWEQTQEDARVAISNKLGYPVIVGDDGLVWMEENEEIILGQLGWTKTNVGGVDGLDKWFFEMEV